MRPYVFGHRGASGYEVENTILAFEKAVSFGAGIESDIRMTRDNKLICFHDPQFKVRKKKYHVNKLAYEEIKLVIFENGREIPLLEDVFQIFSNCSENLRYSLDIANLQVGLEVIGLAKKFSILKRIEITDRRLSVLLKLRNENNQIRLIYTLAEIIKTLTNEYSSINKLKNIDALAINIRYGRKIEDLFKEIIDHGFKCYIWGVNFKTSMKEVLELEHKDETVSAIYTDYPDILLDMISEHFK